MKKNILLVCLFIISMTSAQNQKVIGYYPWWEINKPTSVNNVDFTKLTHLNIAFANPTTPTGNGTLQVSEYVSSEQLTDFIKIVREENPNIEIWISLGGAGAGQTNWGPLLSNSTSLSLIHI